jgi:hypothetical protein
MSENNRDVPFPIESHVSHTVGAALSDLFSHPVRTFVLSWNWKSASLSAVLRAPVFFFSTIRHGWAAISLAVVVEAFYAAGISGCYGTFAEKLRNASPLWLSAFLVTVLAPAILLYFDYVVHRWSGTPNLRRGILASGILAGLSSAFNWFLMRRGSLLVGEGRSSFGADLRCMPRMLLSFILWILRRLSHIRRLFN